MTDIDTRNGHALATTGNDPYSSYGAKVGTTGQYLSFKNGEYLFGANGEELPIGSRLIANMPGLRIGWRCWIGGQVIDDRAELLTAMMPPAKRDALGDTDQGLWERDENDKPRDPWQMTNILELSNGDDTFVYSTGSRGGIGAIGRLCKEYGKQYRMRPGMLPIITLGRDSYMHAVYKKIYTPEFTIIGWTDADAPSLDDADNLAITDQRPGKQATAAAPTRRASSPKHATEIDDEIPF